MKSADSKKFTPKKNILMKGYTAFVLTGYLALFAAEPAMAQSLRAAGENIFNTLYGLVGVVGGISGLVATINWKGGNFLGVQDPKKTFFNTLVGTGLGFGIVGIIQFIKSLASGGSGISGI
jgi:hypothetical protein